MKSNITINIEQEEYNRLKNIESKFNAIIQSDKYIHFEYVCGAGWGCVDYDNYWILSKDETVLKLANKLKCLINSYRNMPLWRRILHHDIQGGPYEVADFTNSKVGRHV